MIVPPTLPPQAPAAPAGQAPPNQAPQSFTAPELRMVQAWAAAVAGTKDWNPDSLHKAVSAGEDVLRHTAAPEHVRQAVAQAATQEQQRGTPGQIANAVSNAVSPYRGKR